MTRELYLKSSSRDLSAAGKQGCRHKDDFILPAELLHWDCSPPSPSLRPELGPRSGKTTHLQQPKAGRRSRAFLGIREVPY